MFKHVVSPLIIPAIDSFLDEMVPQISSNIQDSIWELVRRYSVTSADYFTESGITDNAQLIYRASIDGVDKYYVDKNNSEIRYLPNCIRASSTHFNKFTMLVCLNRLMHIRTSQKPHQLHIVKSLVPGDSMDLVLGFSFSH